MKKKLTLSLFLTSILTGISAGLFTAYVFFLGLEKEIKKDIAEKGNILAFILNENFPIERVQKELPENLRVTLMDSSGQVRFDSEKNISELGPHNNRAEFKMALKNGVGESSRFSETSQIRSFYFAKKLSNGQILRLARPLNSFDEMLKNLYIIWGVLALFLFLLSLKISLYLTRKLLQPVEQLAKNISCFDFDQNLLCDELKPIAEMIQSQNKHIRKQISKLEREHLRMKTIIENMSEGLILFNKNGEVVLKNEHADALYSLSEYKNIFQELLKKSLDGEPCHFELKKGEKLFRLSATPVLSEEKRIGVVFLFFDISTIRAKERFRQEFTANVSHELKTPLTSISGYAELIETRLVPKEDFETLAKKIRLESARLLTLINDILNLSKLDASDMNFETSDVDISALTKECLESLRFKIEEKKISVQEEFSSLVVKGNAAMLYELIYNLVDNAIRYNKESGNIAIVIRDSFQIEDTGIGIPEEHLSRVFERFYRVDKSRSKETGGTGLGLAIVKHIAELHRAHIFVESKVGVGTKIRVEF